jgi:hypothetical protein
VIAVTFWKSWPTADLLRFANVPADVTARLDRWRRPVCQAVDIEPPMISPGPLRRVVTTIIIVLDDRALSR